MASKVTAARRLEMLRQSITTANSAATPPASGGAQGATDNSWNSGIDPGSEPPRSDALLHEFLDTGILLLPVEDVPAASHEQIYQTCKELFEDNPGNEIFGAIPELEQVFSSASVRRALRSVLGEDYAMHRHRHLHSSTDRDQVFHADSHWGINRMRHHRPRLCMVLYYPHTVTLEAGPTAVIPGSQYWEAPLSLTDADRLADAHRSDDHRMRDDAIAAVVHSIDPALTEKKLTVPGGTCVLMNYDMFHRGCRRDEAARPDWRAMLKFQFYATTSSPIVASNPVIATDNSPTSVGIVSALCGSRSLTVATLMDDLRGSTQSSINLEQLPPTLKTVGAALSTLQAANSEAIRMEAAYALSLHARRAKPTAVAALCNVLRNTDTAHDDFSSSRRVGFNGLCPVQRAAMYGLAAAGGQAVQPLLTLIRELRWNLTSSMNESEDELPLQAWVVGNAAVFALGEAAASPTATGADLHDSTHALLGLVPQATASAVAERGPVVEGDRASGGRPRPGQPMGRLLHATLLQSLAVLGQAAVTQLPASLPLVEALLSEALLPTLAASEPGGKYNNTQCQPSRENAALAMVCVAPAIVKAGGALEQQVRVTLQQWVTSEDEEYVSDYLSEALVRLG